MNELARLFATWQAAEAPVADVLRVKWAELERVQRFAAGLRPFADTSSQAARTLARLFAVRRVVTSTPLPPAHELTGSRELTDDVSRFLADRPDHSLCGPLQPLLTALHDLIDNPSPVAARVVEVLCEYGATPDGAPEAVLVVPRRAWVGAVRSWLVSEDLDCVDVACPADLRLQLVTHEAAVLLGHPASTFSSAFRPPEIASRENGWMLTAPTAPRVRLVLTADAPPLHEDGLWLLPRPAHPALDVRDDGVHRDDPMPDGWLQVPDTLARPARRIPRPAAATAEDEVLAVEIHLASGHAVFFHAETGPRPLVVAADDEAGAVALSTATISTVTRGVILATRVGIAPHEEVVTRADAWLRRRLGWTTEKIAEVRDCAVVLKVALRRALITTGRASLHRQLTRSLTDEYARVLLRNPLDEQYIAPQRRAGFDALVNVIGAYSIAERFDDLATVRTAHQQAGEEIRRELLGLLRDRRWVANIDEEGWTVLQAGELGALMLAVVTARLDELVPIAGTWLGVLVDDKGRRVTTLAVEGRMS